MPTIGIPGSSRRIIERTRPGRFLVIPRRRGGTLERAGPRSDVGSRSGLDQAASPAAAIASSVSGRASATAR